MYLTGTYRHSLDAKRRLTLPAAFRGSFDNVVCVICAGGRLWAFTPEGHRAWVQSFFPNGFRSGNQHDEQTRFKLNANTTTVDIDSAGRIALGRLSPRDLEKCGIEKEVCVVGNEDHFEIWSAPRLDEMLEQLDSAGSVLDNLNLG